jgi:hypothetical protein
MARGPEDILLNASGGYRRELWYCDGACVFGEGGGVSRSMALAGPVGQLGRCLLGMAMGPSPGGGPLVPVTVSRDRAGLMELLMLSGGL